MQCARGGRRLLAALALVSGALLPSSVGGMSFELLSTIEYNPPPQTTPGTYDKAGQRQGEDFGWVRTFDFSPRTDLLAALTEEPGSGLRRLVIVDLRGGKVHATAELSDERRSAPWGMSVSPDGTMVAVPEGRRNRVSLYDLASGRAIATGTTDDSATYTAWHPDGETFAVVSGKSVEIWEVDPLRRQRFVPGARSRDATESVFAAEWHPDGDVMVIGTNRPAVYVGHPSSGRQSGSLSAVPGPAYRLEWSPSGTLLAVAGHGRGSGVAVFRDVTSRVLTAPGRSTDEHLRTFDPPPGGQWTAMAWHPEGRALALVDGTSSELTVRDVESGTILVRLEPHPGETVTGMAWRRDRLITAGGDRTLKVWQVGTVGSQPTVAKEPSLQYEPLAVAPGPLKKKVPSPATSFSEDCLSYDAEALRIAQIEGRFKIVEGASYLFDFGEREEAETALGIIRRFGFDRVCYVGRGKPAMTYGKKGSVVPGGSSQGLDCVSFARDGLRVERQGKSWILRTDRSSMVAFTNQELANRAAEIVKTYRLNRQCFVGRPDPSFVFWLAE